MITKTKNKTHSILCIMICFSMLLACPAFASTTKWHSSVTYNNFVRSGTITSDQLNACVAALNEAKNVDRSNYSYPATNTGIYADSYVETEIIACALDKYFLGTDDFVAFSGPADAYGTMTFDPDWATTGKAHLSTKHEGSTSGYEVYVAWNPAADPDKSLREHYEAEAVVNNVLANAPADTSEKIKYFHDYICNAATYDYENMDTTYNDTCRSVYGTLIEGKAICTGYSKTFFILCDRSGITCIDTSCEVGENKDPHSKDAILNNGIWYGVDTTFDDNDENGISYTNFMYQLSDTWQHQFTLPEVELNEYSTVTE